MQPIMWSEGNCATAAFHWWPSWGLHTHSFTMHPQTPQLVPNYIHLDCCLHAPNWILSLQQSKWFEPCKIAHSSLYCDLKLPSLSALLFSDWSFSHSNVCQQEQKPFPFLILHSMGQWSVVVPAETILNSILLPLVNLATRSALAVSCCCCTWSRDSINQISIGIQSPSVLHVFPCAKNSNCL